MVLFSKWDTTMSLAYACFCVSNCLIWNYNRLCYNGFMKYKNTLQRGSARFIIFREDDTWYGACLEFNIVESGDTPQEAMILLSESVQGYLESAKKIKDRPNILNQRSDPEYEDMWTDLLEAKKQNKQLESVYSYGQMMIPQVMSGQSFATM